MKKELIYGKRVGGDNPPQVQAELAEWDRVRGKLWTSPADWACGPDRALDALDDLGVPAYLLLLEESSDQVVCLFQHAGELVVTEPAGETDAANQALVYVVRKTKSALT